jgi:putative spermidine/putrescine transport system permease protein
MISAARHRTGKQLEAAGSILGASPWQVFWRITLPGLRAGIVASLMFGFLIAFNFLTLSLFVSGIRTQTLPLVVFYLTFENVSPMVTALGTLMAAASFAIMLVLERKFGIYDVLSQRRGI